MMMAGRKSKKLAKICLISEGPHGASTLRGGHCHTCDSSTPHICIGPNAGPTTSYGYIQVDRLWQTKIRNRLPTGWNRFLHKMSYLISSTCTVVQKTVAMFVTFHLLSL